MRPCIIGVNARGEKYFLAIGDGVRESTQSWTKLRGFDYLAKVITGVKFTDGIETNTNNQAAA